MKFRTALLAGAALIVTGVCGQAGELRGTYFAVEGGGSWVGDERFLVQFLYTAGLPSTSEIHSTFDTGWAAFASVGYGFGEGWRAEIEGGYRHNNIDHQVDSFGMTITPTGELSEFTLMANILYDLQLSDSLSLSIGAGVGADHAHLDLGSTDFDDDDWVWAYQGILGLNYAFGDRAQLFLNYRYMRVDAPAFAVFYDDAPDYTQNVALRRDLNKQAVTLGMRFALQGEAVPPPPAPPPPPPPPAAPPAPKEFIVFFGYDKSELSPEAQRVVEDAAYAANEWGSASILIVGHTDSMGSNSYNQALSTRRANTVRSALQALGIAGEKITATGKGESELMVQTGDRVKEPQNRRATINLQ